MKTEKTDGVEIDDLLAKMSPDLVRRYEECNLSGPILSRVNEEYRAASKKVAKSEGLSSLTGMLILVGGAFLVAITSIFKGEGISSATFVSGWTFILLGFFLSRRAEKAAKEAREACKERAKVLKNFRRAVEALESPVGATMWEYTEASTRNNFVTHAVRILDVEIKLDVLRRQEWRDEYGLQHLVNFLLGCREKFQAATWTLQEAFGLKFDNKELFAEAKAHLQRSGVVVP